MSQGHLWWCKNISNVCLESSHIRIKMTSLSVACEHTSSPFAYFMMLEFQSPAHRSCRWKEKRPTVGNIIRRKENFIKRSEFHSTSVRDKSDRRGGSVNRVARHDSPISRKLLAMRDPLHTYVMRETGEPEVTLQLTSPYSTNYFRCRMWCCLVFYITSVDTNISDLKEHKAATMELCDGT
jgi:hypothetical protein